MNAGMIIVCYLAVGVLAAGLFAYSVKVGIDRLGQDDAVMRDLEKTVGAFPGGMAGVLVLLALLWPAAVAAYVRSVIKK